MHFDGSLLLAKLRPGKQRQAEIDGGRVQRVEAAIQFHAHGIARVKRSRDTDQYLCEVGEDAPVVSFVGICQRGPRHLAAKAQMVQLALHRTQTCFDIPQALTVSQLREGHGKILIPARETPAMIITAVAGHTFLELLVREMGDQLREHQPASMHPPLSAGVRIPSKRSFGQFGISNRSRAKTPPPTTIETSSGL